MTILVTGSAGKTASQLTKLLTPTHKVLIASRKPKPDALLPTVAFDWLDESAWSSPFSHDLAQESPVTAVYLVSPDVAEARAQVIPFVHFARSKDVKRFVLLSAWEIPENGPLLGKAHAALKAMEKEGVEWTVLRPHFFMENFGEPYHLPCIRDESKIYTACAKGGKPYISARDIAAVAHRALIDEKPHNTDYVITGSESLSYDEVAEIFTKILGREIEHVVLAKEDLAQKMVKEFDYSPDMAEYLADLDVRCSLGEGAEPTDNVLRVTGKEPWKMRDIISDMKQNWEPQSDNTSREVLGVCTI